MKWLHAEWLIWYKTNLYWKPVRAGLVVVVSFSRLLYYKEYTKNNSWFFYEGVHKDTHYSPCRSRGWDTIKQEMSIDSLRPLRKEQWFIKTIKDRSCCSLIPGNRKFTHIRTDQEVRKPCHPSPGACVSLCDLYKGCDVWPTAKVGCPLPPPPQTLPGLHSPLDTADDLLWSVYMHHLGSELQCRGKG